MIDTTILKLVTNSDKIIAVVLLVALGFLIRFMLNSFGQTWIRTKSHTSTLLILPIITFIITNVIAGNIALSLGMVGALSIVRFRHPVRSPLELSIYFFAITMGIAAGVSLLWLGFLTISILFAVGSLIVVNLMSKKFLNKDFFITSFSEGNSMSMLSVVTQAPVDILEKHEALQSKITAQQEGTITYSLASQNFLVLKKIEENKDVRSNSLSLDLRR